MTNIIFTWKNGNMFILIIFVSIDDDDNMKIVMTNKRCALFVCLTSTRWWRVCIRVFLYVCVCVCACPEIFFFCAFKQRDEDAAVAAQGRPSRSRVFFFLIYIFFEKRKTRNACCWCWSDAGDCCCCFRSFNVLLWCPDSFLLQPFSSLVLLPSTRLPFLLFSFCLSFSLFFFLLLSLFLLHSPWVMSNLCMLCF